MKHFDWLNRVEKHDIRTSTSTQIVGDGPLVTDRVTAGGARPMGKIWTQT